MKQLKHILEGILGDIEDRINTNDAENLIRYEVGKFLEDHYLNHRNAIFKISAKPNKDGLFEVSINGSVTAKGNLPSITNGKFVWTYVKGNFDLCLQHNITSLEGCPRHVGGKFNCSLCENLESLKGGPDRVDGVFDCAGCHELVSLEGSPEFVGDDFLCNSCINLKSLKGCP